MPAIKRNHLEDARGLGRLAVDAAAGIVDVVERMHRTVQRVPGPLGAAVEERTRGVTGMVYRGVRGGLQMLGEGLDAALTPLAALLPEGAHPPQREGLVCALNGVYGDHLALSGNPLAIGMSLRHAGSDLDLAHLEGSLSAAGATPASGKLLVLVHGLCMSDLAWRRHGHDHGAALAAALGYTPVYVRYNSGLHIHDNGRQLAAQLESLVSAWPTRVRELVLLGHSMGGLVMRSAELHGREHAQRWRGALRRMIFLGTPHQGAPLERGGHWIDQALELSPYAAPFSRLGKTRSAGIRDLRHGTITPDGSHTHALPVDVECMTVAATLSRRRHLVAERLLGDGLVPLNSALGEHRDVARRLDFAPARRRIVYETGHLELLSRPEVYAQLLAWLGPGRPMLLAAPTQDAGTVETPLLPQS
ncbi:MAG TPA: alpha/beta hydrolase [Burkholderiaceae bacterium]|nr:alpha/beta hydrolase [Burkholderiaceae bacterium]